MSDDLLHDAPDKEDVALRGLIFQDVIQEHQAEKAYGRDRTRLWRFAGIAGMAIGVCGMACGTAAIIYMVPKVSTTVIDNAAGVIMPSFGAEDAPKHYSERVRRHYIAEYTGLRESFVWQMDPVTDHRIKLMSSPAEQARYQAERDKHNPLDRYGMKGYARVVRFEVNSFKDRSGTGDDAGKDDTLEYDVQFVKGEVLALNPSVVTESRMTARIVFQFHPELAMTEQDRLDNESGMMVISYNSSVDP